jgi:type II secretory pathway pseudopilin PulG
MQAKVNIGHQRFAANAGIAVGPILFIIAVLAILAAAIAAGSGNFTSGTNQEANRTKAAAIIDLGQNLRIGMDRLVLEAGYSPTQVLISPNSTVNNTDLFSPLGGGVTTPSTALANDPINDTWYYPTGPVPSMGTANNDYLAVLKVTAGTCDQINLKSNSVVTPAGADLGNFTANTAQANINAMPFTGKAIGCVNNTNASSNGYYFFQVLAVQ